MKLLKFIMLVAALFVVIDAKKKKADPEVDIEVVGQKKMAEIEKLEAKFSDKIIKFTPQQYTKLVLQNPRPYDVVMVFNVDKNCQHCEEFGNEFEQVVYSFTQERGSQAKEMQKEKKIFFGTLVFQQDREVQMIYKGHNFLTVPYMAVSSMNLKRDSKLEGFFGEQDIWHVQSTEVYDAQKQIDFLNNHLRTDVKIRFTFMQIMIKNLIGMGLILGLFSLVQVLYKFLLYQIVWFFVAIAAYVICTGGLVYSMINQMPWFKFERNEFGAVVITEYFMRGQRGQWAGEGYIISVLVTIIGLVYLYLNNVDKWVKERMGVRIAVVISLVSIFILQQMLLAAYRIKSPWYNPTFSPPDYYQRGSLLADQGNNI